MRNQVVALCLLKDDFFVAYLDAADYLCVFVDFCEIVGSFIKTFQVSTLKLFLEGLDLFADHLFLWHECRRFTLLSRVLQFFRRVVPPVDHLLALYTFLVQLFGLLVD